jgi:hypothetical protein
MVNLLLEAGANPRLRDRQYDAPPSRWALTSVEDTGNAKCVDVAAQLQRVEAMAGG